MNGTKRLLVGTVLSVQNTSFTYPACPNCFSRLIHTRIRYECPRCGDTCKAATQRYKLCVKVAEDQKLHLITVFGRCLENVFGTSADALHRHLLGPAQLPGPVESGRAQELLFQAAEYCLIGQSFIFTVKIPGDLGRGDSVPLSDSLRNMVACQIILPNDDPIGCTILNHFNRLAQPGLSNSLTNARADISTDTALGDSRDLGISDGSLSQCRNPFADYWQQSLGLSPSPLGSTSSESALCDGRPCRCNRPEQLFHGEDHKSQENKVSAQRQINPTEDVLVTTPCRNTSTPRTSQSSLRTPKTPNAMRYCKPQSSLCLHRPCFKSKIDFRQESSMQKICGSGGCRSQGGPTCGGDFLPQNLQAAEIHQGPDGTWEDFPFSESLSNVIAGIEDGEGTRSPFCITENEFYLNLETEGSYRKGFREPPDFIKTPDVILTLSAEKSEHGTGSRTPEQYSSDESDGSNTLVLNHSCEIGKTDDNHLPSVQSISPSGNLQRSLEESHAPNYISRDSCSTSPANQDCSVTPQHTCSPHDENVVSNCAKDKGSFKLCNVSRHPIENINTRVISLGKGVFSSLNGNGINSTWEDVDLGELITSDLNRRDHDSEVYNASSDLFDASNNIEGTSAVIHHPHYTESLEKQKNKMNKQYLKYTLHDSPCADVIPYCLRPSHTREVTTQGCDFVPYLQSTPVLRRLSEVNCFTGERRLSTNTSIAKSSIFSIGRRSNGPVTNFLLRKTRLSLSERRSTMFCAVSDNFPLLYSPVPASFSISPVRTLKRRSSMFVCKSMRRKTILENKENAYHNGPNNEIGCTVTKLDGMNANIDEIDECGNNTLDNIANLSPVICSSQHPASQLFPIQTHLPSDWSPELFSEKSNVCRQSDDLQRRLF